MLKEFFEKSHHYSVDEILVAFAHKQRPWDRSKITAKDFVHVVRREPVKISNKRGWVYVGDDDAVPNISAENASFVWVLFDKPGAIWHRDGHVVMCANTMRVQEAKEALREREAPYVREAPRELARGGV